VKLEYTLTMEDYKAALDLHHRRRISLWLTYLLWFRVIPVAAVVLSSATIYFFAMKRPRIAHELIPFDIGLIFLSIVLPALYVFSVRKGFKRLFPPNRTERGSSIDIDEEQIFSGIPGISEAKTFWKGIVAFAQDDKITMLYISKDRFLFFPTSVMSLSQRAELNELIVRHGIER
jgi:uncharacterized membrane protein (DUF485 family)